MQITLTVSVPQELPVSAGAGRPSTHLFLVEFTVAVSGTHQTPDDAFFVYRVLDEESAQCCAVASYHQLKSLPAGSADATNGFFRQAKGVFACYSLEEQQRLTEKIKDDLNLLVADWNAAQTLSVAQTFTLTGTR